MRRLGGVVALYLLLRPLAAGAVQLDALEIGRDWRLRVLQFEGNHALARHDLEDAMIVKARPWYRSWIFWRPLPEFDPVAFRNDLVRLRQLYRNRGYYHARIEHDLELPADGTALTAVVYVDEGPPVRVADVTVALRGTELPRDAQRLLLEHLPVVRGDVFSADAYERAHVYLRTYYREHGFARVRVGKHADVDVRTDRASVRFDVDSGPPSVFGDLHVSGTRSVDPDVVRLAAAFHPGEPFKQSLVERTRDNLVALRLFRSIRVDEGKGDDPRVDVLVKVVEGPKHEVRFGVGYDTEEQIRGLASWRDYDFLGGARQLGFTARASLIRQTAVADFLQPHFPGPRDRVRLLLSYEQEDEDAYTNDRARISPRIEWQALPRLTPYAFYRLEYDTLVDVTPAVKRLRPDIAPGHGLLSGFGVGADWNDVDDLIDPSRGWVASTVVEPVGGVLGGDFSFVRMLVEGRRYQPLPYAFSAAARMRVGTEKPLAGTRDVPLFERLYAGGINSVRGYGRREVGPDAAFIAGDPIGGLSLVETSVELRHPVTEKIGAAVFLDAGQLSLQSFTFPFGDLEYGTGFGLRYKSPVGPLRADLGFPINPRPDDQRWQVYVSIGQTF